MRWRVDTRGIWVSNQVRRQRRADRSSRNQVAQRVGAWEAGVSGLAIVGRGPVPARRRPSLGRRPWRGDARAADQRAHEKRARRLHRLHRLRASAYTYVAPLLADDRRRPHRVLTRSAVWPARSSCPDPRDFTAGATDGGRTYTFQLRPGIRYSNAVRCRRRTSAPPFERFFALGSPVTDYDGIRRRRAMPEASEAVRPLARDRRRRPCPHRDLPPDPAGPLLSLHARVTSSAYVLPGGHAAAAGRNASAARDRPLHDRDLPAGEAS